MLLYVTMKTEAAIGLGSNIGNRQAFIQDAISRLSKLSGVTLIAQSSVYETEPVDVPAEFANMPFLNAVALFDVEGDVLDWSKAVHAIEADMLRIRGSVPHTPRTIDLDLLYFGNTTLNEPHLHLPHPQCTVRRFVCQPLAELRPNLVLPGESKSIAEILATLPTTPAVKRYTPTR